MNPHYNQQPPYYNNNYQQNIPGPPQPPWQSPGPQSPVGWNDPRFQSLPPPPPQSPGYGQTSFGQPPGHASPFPPAPGVPGSSQHLTQRPQESYNRPISPQYDTSQWGVRYNQNQHNQYQPEASQALQPEQRPALPPRPHSSLAQAIQQQQQPHGPVGNYQQPPTQYQHQPQGSWSIPLAQPQEHKPPTPPPRPAAYAAPYQYTPVGVPQEQYSHHAATDHYTPHHQPQPSWQQPQHPRAPATPTRWNQTSQAADGPVSPMEDERRRNSLVAQPPKQYVDSEPPSQNVDMPSRPARISSITTPEVQTGATALGGFGGGPSDWQHYDLSSQQENVGGSESQPLPESNVDSFTASPQQNFSSARPKSSERVRPPSKTASPYPPPQGMQQQVANDLSQRLGLHPVEQVQVSAASSQVPDRQDSRQSEMSSVSGFGHGESIDNVIQAWSAPLVSDSSVQTSLPPTRTQSHHESKPVLPKVELRDHEAQTDFEPQVETKIETRVETKEVEIDPYADIQNEYKATLKRFASMLRQEAAADNDEEKFKIFQGFVIREVRLRSVLYGVDVQHSEPASTSGLNLEKGQQGDGQVQPPQVPAKSGDQHSVITQKQTPKQQQPPHVNTQASPSPNSKDDSFVMVNASEDDDYSPGGRPRMNHLRIATPRPATVPPPDSLQRSIAPMPNTQDSGKESPSLNAPMTFDDYVMPDVPSPSANAPIVVGSDNIVNSTVNNALTEPLNFQPDRPLYQPFRYGTGPEGQIPLVSVQGPPTESFAVHRQNQATESGRTLVHDMPPTDFEATPNRGHAKSPSGGRKEHEEAFIGLIRAKSQAIRKKSNTTPRPDSPAILRAGTPANRSTSSPAPISPFVKSVQSLRGTVPKAVPVHPGPKSAPHPKLQPVVAAMLKVPDDFNFIHARVLSWDKSNRQLRFKQETERQARQSYNEEHIDQLFNDNEIGYADIGELEKDFRLAEAERKYREDQDELESFTKGVFDFVSNKIEGEVSDLTRLQTNAIDILDLESASAAKQVQSAASQPADGASSLESAPISAIMQLLLEIHAKLEIRHLKIAEASFERERRRKRLELSVLYTNNDKVGIKKLEAEFAKAEKLQVLEASRKKAERANKLLDSFDRVVVRGLAENQAVVDDVLGRLQLVRDLVLGPEDHAPPGQGREDLLYGPEGVRELMDRTSATINFIHTDSKVLVQLLDKADTLSNDADFDLYMSEARLADATPEKYEKLKSEKAAEDIKVGEELTSRLNGIARSPDEITALVKEVKDKIGGDAGHEERIEKALEAAKRRNTESVS